MPHQIGEEYLCPKTEVAGKVLGGQFPKDSGKFSSRIGQVVKQALKVPGPGIYKIPEGPTGRQFVFAKGSKETNIKAGKRPDPGQYEQSKKACLPRTLQGVMSKGKKVTFVDIAAMKANQYPGPPKYNPKEVLGHIQSRALHVTTTQSRLDLKSRRDLPGPGKYNPVHTNTEDRVLAFALGPKYKSFEEAEAKRPGQVPGPNSYKLIELDKISRGTKLMQTYNYDRGPMTGYF